MRHVVVKRSVVAKSWNQVNKLAQPFHVFDQKTDLERDQRFLSFYLNFIKMISNDVYGRKV